MSGRPRLALAAMVAAVAVVTLDTTILNVAIPTIRRDLHTNLASLEWVIAGYSLTLGSLLIIGGRVGDVLGVRRTFPAGAVVFAAGSLLASLATTTPQLILGEAVIEGIGASLLFPASLAALSLTFQGPARAKAFALWGGVAGAAAALGPVIGGWLTTSYSWRWGFRINVLVAPLAALAAWAAVPASTARPAGRAGRWRVDLRGAALLAAGLFLVVYALTEETGLALAGAAVALIAFWRVERGTTDPLVDLTLFARRSFGGGLATAAAVVMAQAGTMFVMTVSLQATHHLSPIATGRWLLPVGLAALAGAQVGGRRAGAAGATAVVRAGILVELAGVLAAAVLISPDVAWASLAVALAAFGFGAGMASSQLTNVVLSEVPRERAGSASGVSTTNSAIAAALGVTIVGAMLRAGTARGALLAVAALLAAGSAASFVIPHRRPSGGETLEVARRAAA